MQLQKLKHAEVHDDGEVNDSIKMTLDMESAEILMSMLSKNLYSDAIGSLIRETASNALDSHRKAGVKKPIIVSLTMNSNNYWEFSVEDFGLGLNDDDVENIISKYGKSTKRMSDNELGMYGLGFKSPLAYSSSFTFVCKKDGVSRTYMMFEGEGGNELELLLSSKTDDSNGVKIVIPVKKTDKYAFEKKIKEQLCYFEDVWFEVEGISNDFTIYRDEDYQMSKICPDQNFHISLDNVYYPIDYSKLGISSISGSVALRFNLTDGIMPTPSRESIIYTPEVIKIVTDKIAKISDKMIAKYNDQVTDIENIKEAYDSSLDYGKTLVIESFNINTSQLRHFSTNAHVDVTIKGIEGLNVESLLKDNDMFSDYSISMKLRSYTFTTKRLGSVIMSDIISCNFYLYDTLSGVKKDYYRELNQYNKTAYFIKKTDTFTLYGTSRYSRKLSLIKLLSLRNDEKHLWRSKIENFVKLRKMIFDEFVINDSDVAVSKEFIEERKKRYAKRGIRLSKERKQEGQFLGKLGVRLKQNLSDRWCKWESTNFDVQNFNKKPRFYVYSHVDDTQKLEELYSVSDATFLKCITLSSRELKQVEKLDYHNLISYEKFMKGDNAPFKRIVTAYLIQQLKSDNYSLFSRSENFKSVSMELYEDMEKLTDYVVKHYQSGSDEIYESMYALALEHDLFDYSIMPVYNKIKKTFEKIGHLNFFFNKLSYYIEKDKKCEQILSDVMRYNKVKLNLDHYQKKEEEIKEEVI